MPGDYPQSDQIRSELQAHLPQMPASESGEEGTVPRMKYGTPNMPVTLPHVTMHRATHIRVTIILYG